MKTPGFSNRLPKAMISPDTEAGNYTNEGGYDYRFRFLKNIMGLWMIQQVRHDLKDAYSFAQLCEMAEEAKDFPTRVDVQDVLFLAPDSMIGAIKEYAAWSKQPVPQTVGEIATVVYQSLAECYADTVLEIETITGRHYDAVNIVGGGSKAGYLNKLTAEKSGRKVLAGPGEATAIGNLTAQMISAGVFKDLKEARQNIFESFGVEVIEP